LIANGARNGGARWLVRATARVQSRRHSGAPFDVAEGKSLNLARLRRAARTPLLFLSLALASSASIAPAATPAPARPTDQFIVKFRDGRVEQSDATRRQQRLDAAAHAQGLQVGQLRRLAVGAEVVRTNRALDAAGARAFVARLRADPRVEYADIDARMQVHYTPDDEHYGLQWHYFDETAGIGAPSAWDLADGSGQVVAVLDTGITGHPDLTPNEIAGYDFISDPTTANDGDGRDPNPFDPGDWAEAGECNLTGPYDSTWHGTHVAGTIAAVTGNATGVAGVAFGANYMPVRVIGTCGGDTSDVIDAIVWASGGSVAGVDDNPAPADVITLSIGFGGACFPAMQAAIDTAVANGAVVVASAGNANDDAANMMPASCDNLLAVAAVGRDGERAWYSNYGGPVDIAAPGGDDGELVWSTINGGDTVPGDPGYTGYNGTSMAAAHVAGVAALIGDAANGTLEPAEIMNLIQATARPLPVACPEGCGAGLVDAASAVVMASQPLLTINDVSAAEGADGSTQVYTFTVSLSEPAAADITFNASTANATAHAGSDFVAAAWPGAVIPAGNTSASFEVTVNGDDAAEIDETFSFVVGDVSGPASVLEDVATGTLVNDDDMPPDISISDASVVEGNGGTTVLTFTVAMNDTSAHPVTFDIATADGTATAGSDYVAAPLASDSIAAGEMSKTFSVTVNGDTADEANEVLYANLYNVSGAALVDDTGVGTITNDDGPRLSVSDAAITEGNSGTKVMTFTVSLSQASASTVWYYAATANNTATAGSDYVAPAIVGHSIPAGQLSNTFSVTINGDTAVEANEILRANLSSATVSILDAQGTGTIINDDGPVLSIADAGFVEGDSSMKILTFTVSLSQASASPVTYDIATGNGTATAGTDYFANSLSGQSIPAGQTSKTFFVTVNGDTTVEGNEAFFVALSNGSVSIADPQAKGTITNDDGATLSIGDASLTEADSGTTMMTFTVTLSQVAGAPVTFNFATANGTALAGPDFVPVSVTGLKIPAGQLTKLVSVPIKGDLVVEANETLQANISMGNVSIKDGVGIGTINNDD
jgi:serine protease